MIAKLLFRGIAASSARTLLRQSLDHPAKTRG